VTTGVGGEGGFALNPCNVTRGADPTPVRATKSTGAPRASARARGMAKQPSRTEATVTRNYLGCREMPSKNNRDLAMAGTQIRRASATTRADVLARRA